MMKKMLLLFLSLSLSLSLHHSLKSTPPLLSVVLINIHSLSLSLCVPLIFSLTVHLFLSLSHTHTNVLISGGLPTSLGSPLLMETDRLSANSASSNGTYVNKNHSNVKYFYGLLLKLLWKSSIGRVTSLRKNYLFISLSFFLSALMFKHVKQLF